MIISVPLGMRVLLVLSIMLAALAGGVAPAATQPAEKGAIGALATLQPKSGMVQLTGKPGHGIAALPVETGMEVKQGDLIAVYDNRDDLALQVRLIEAELAELEGNHQRDEALQQLQIASANEDLKQKLASLERYQQLNKTSQVDAVLVERRSAIESARYAMRIAQAEKARLATRNAAAIAKAKIRLELARNAVSQAELRSPISGTIMKLHKNVGEASDGPIVTLADLTRMQAVGDVYEGDLARVKVGQSVEAKANALTQPLAGKVVLIGREVKAESRVAKVWIDLADSAVASRYIGMEVNVTIRP